MLQALLLPPFAIVCIVLLFRQWPLIKNYLGLDDIPEKVSDLSTKQPGNDEKSRIEPLLDFEITKTVPIKYRPYRTQGHITMGGYLQELVPQKTFLTFWLL